MQLMKNHQNAEIDTILILGRMLDIYRKRNRCQFGSCRKHTPRQNEKCKSFGAGNTWGRERAEVTGQIKLFRPCCTCDTYRRRGCGKKDLEEEPEIAMQHWESLDQVGGELESEDCQWEESCAGREALALLALICSLVGSTWEEPGLRVNPGVDLKDAAPEGSQLTTFLTASSLLKDLSSLFPQRSQKSTGGKGGGVFLLKIKFLPLPTLTIIQDHAQHENQVNTRRFIMVFMWALAGNLSICCLRRGESWWKMNAFPFPGKGSEVGCWAGQQALGF